MRIRYTKEFRTKFGMAFANYEAGEWDVAKKMLEGIPELLPEMMEEEDLTQNLTTHKKVDADGHPLPEGQKGDVIMTSRKLANIWKRKAGAGRLKVQVTKKTPKQDGPSLSLLTFMKGYDYKAPKDWPGYRKI